MSSSFVVGSRRGNEELAPSPGFGQAKFFELRKHSMCVRHIWVMQFRDLLLSGVEVF